MIKYLILTIISYFVSGIGFALVIMGCMQDVDMAIIFGCASFIGGLISGLSWVCLFFKTFKVKIRPLPES